MENIEKTLDGGGDLKDTDNLNVDLNSVPVRVLKVNLNGMWRTHNDYVQPAIQEVFKATTFEDLIFKVGEAQSKLKKLEAFVEVGSIVDTSKVPDAPHDAYEVTFIVKEVRIINGGMNTSVGSNEGNVKFTLKFPNVLGRGEKLSFDHDLSSSWERNSELSFYKPLPNKNKDSSNMTTSIFQTRVPNTLSGFNYSSIGTLFGYNFKPTPQGTCQVQWQGSWRQITATGVESCLPVRESCGHSVKSALKCIFGSDRRDQMIFPNRGHVLKVTSELAGLLGDARFWKTDAEFQHNLPLFKGIVLQSSIRGGILQSLSTSASNCSIYDHFFLGGPTSLRGFAMRGVGPRGGIQRQNSLGGKAYWSAALHLFSPLPYSVGRYPLSDVFRTHAFINAGSLSSCLSDGNIWSIRASYGLGIAIRLGNSAKIEVNYCWPLRFTKEDQVIRGIQVGLGIDFL